jgi:hypothetical protein
MSLAHVATCGPCMRVSAMDTFRIGELRPRTLEFAWKYLSKLSRKVQAFFLSPSNTWGRFPITLSLVFPAAGAATGTAAGGP